MKCKQCNCEIAKGGKYIGERFVSLSFCSEACYKAYCKAKDTNPMELLKRELDTLYAGDINWMLMTKQIQSYNKQYGLSPQDIRVVIRYAMKYAGHNFDASYMLGQFIPSYVEEALKFAEDIRHNQDLARQWEPTEREVPTKIKSSRVGINKKNMEW